MTSGARLRAGFVAALVAGVALAGCGDDGDTTVLGGGDGAPSTSDGAADGSSTDDTVDGEPTVLEGTEVTVSAIDNTFRPANIEIEAGAEVTWSNDGRNDHNVLPVDDGAWGVEAEDFGPDDVYSNRFAEPGTYAYYCSLHGTTTKGMVGTITVTG